VVLAPLAAQQACSRMAARAAGLELGLSERQIYNWIRRLRLANGNLAALAPRGSRTTKGVTRLSPDTEAELGRIVTEEVLQRAGGRQAGLFAAIVKRCQQEISSPPSASTIFRRLRGCIASRPADQDAAHTARCESPGVMRRVPPEHPADTLQLPV
jgi:hypothetical protein